MRFKMVHNNFNVFDLEKSLAFYREALGLEVARESRPEHGKFVIVYLKDGNGDHLLELTWMKDWEKPYELGDNEIHLAFVTDNFEGAHKKHKEMGCICYENEAMGIYFIEDPDGYWLEILPDRRGVLK